MRLAKYAVLNEEQNSDEFSYNANGSTQENGVVSNIEQQS